MRQYIYTKAAAIRSKARTGLTRLVRDRRGDLATNTIGAIIIAVVVIGILITAIDAFFPTFFSGMFRTMETKLNANW